MSTSSIASAGQAQRSPRSPPTRPSATTSTLSLSPKHQAISRPSSSHSSGTAKKPSSLHETDPSAVAMNVDAGTAPSSVSAAGKANSPATTSTSARPTPAPTTAASPAHQEEPTAPSSQLALLLSSALAESESLRAALQSAERRARRAERVLAALQLPSGASSSSSSSTIAAADAAGVGSAPSEDIAKTTEDEAARDEDEDMEKDSEKEKSGKESTTMPEAAVKAILDAEARAERAERHAQDTQTHLHLLLSHYTTFERYLATLELRQADARGAFTRVVHALTEEALTLSPSSPSPQGTSTSAARTHGMHLPRVPSPYHTHTQPTASPPAGSSAGKLGGGLRNHQLQHQQQPSAGSAPFRMPLPGYPLSSVDHAGVGTFHALPLPPPPSASTAAGAAAHLYNTNNAASSSNGSSLHAHPAYTHSPAAHASQIQLLNGAPNGNGAASSYTLVPSKRGNRRGARVNGTGSVPLGNGSGAGDEWAGGDHDVSMAEGVKRRRVWDGDESPIPSPLAHHHSVHGQHQHPSTGLNQQQHYSQQPSPPYTHRPITNSALGARRYEHETHGEYYRDAAQPGAKGTSGYDPVRGYAATPEEYARGGASRHVRHTNSAHHQHHRRAGDGRGRSASRSSADSWSIDEMLLETATDGGGGGNGGNGSAGSGRERYNEDLERYMRGHDRSRGGAAYDARTARGRGEVAARGDANLGPSVQTYQTHIFAPPVTGAPTKKAKGSSASAASPSAPASFSGAPVANGAVSQGGALGEGGRGGVPAAQLVTLGPGGVVVSGGGAATAPPPSALPGGGYPPQNAQGQRICRQCGMPGRYKEGKCVEKWGPGPEGPGTVCDRCRKKMKRVERRGTIDQAASHAVLAQTQNALLQHQQNHQAAQQQQQQGAVPATVTTPAAGLVGPQMHARASHTQTQPYGQAAQQGMARGDTMIIERGREDRDRTQLLSPRPTSLTAGREYAPRGSRGHSPLGDRSTYHSTRSQNTPANAAHLLHAQTGPQAQSNGSSGGRRPPTPPYINSISTREQQAYGSVAGDNGEDELADGDGDGEGEGELDVDAEIVRALPSAGGRGMGARSPGTSTTASVGSGGSPRANGTAKSAAALLHVGANGRYANGYGSKHAAAAVHNGHNHHNAHLRYSNTRGGERDRDSMDLDLEDAEADADADGDADVDADADADAELLDAVDAATASAGGGRMKEEDL